MVWGVWGEMAEYSLSPFYLLFIYYSNLCIVSANTSLPRPEPELRDLPSHQLWEEGCCVCVWEGMLFAPHIPDACETI